MHAQPSPSFANQISHHARAPVSTASTTKQSPSPLVAHAHCVGHHITPAYHAVLAHSTFPATPLHHLTLQACTPEKLHTLYWACQPKSDHTCRGSGLSGKMCCALSRSCSHSAATVSSWSACPSSRSARAHRAPASCSFPSSLSSPSCNASTHHQSLTCVYVIVSTSDVDSMAGTSRNRLHGTHTSKSGCTDCSLF